MIRHDTEEPRVASPRTILIGLVIVVVVGVGVVLLLGKAAGYRELLAALQNASGGWLIACLLLEAASCAGYVVCLRAIVAQGDGPKLSTGQATRTWLATLGATRIVSPAGAGGMAIFYWLLRKAGLRRRPAVSRVLGFNVLIFSLFGAWAFATSLVILIDEGGAAPLGMVIPWLIIVPVVGVAGLWASQGARGRRVSADVRRGWARKVLAGAVSGIVVARDAMGQPRPNGPALWGAAAYWVGDVLCLWAALKAVGAEVPLAGVALAYATAYTTMLLPLPTGGYGALDAASAFTLTVLGIPLAEAVAGVVVWRFFSFWLPTIPALIELARARDLARTLSGQSEQGPEPAEAGGP